MRDYYGDYSGRKNPHGLPDLPFLSIDLHVIVPELQKRFEVFCLPISVEVQKPAGCHWNDYCSTMTTSIVISEGPSHLAGEMSQLIWGYSQGICISNATGESDKKSSKDDDGESSETVIVIYRVVVVYTGLEY